MVYVKKQPGDSPDSLIKKFSRKVMNEGIIKEMKIREYHLKPSLFKKHKKEVTRKFARQYQNRAQG